MGVLKRNNGTNIFIVLIFIIVLAVLIYFAYYRSTNSIIHDPTFVGEVINKETVKQQINIGMTIPRHQVLHRLHIIGTYYAENQRVYVDRIFTVTDAIYNHFEIGDIICSESINRVNYLFCEACGSRLVS